MGAVDVGTGLIGVLPYRTVIEDEKASLILVVEDQVMILFCAWTAEKTAAARLVVENFIF